MDVVKKFNIGFAVFHLVAFIAFAFYVKSVYARDGQAQLLWIYWMVVDFPVSLLLLLAKAVGFRSYSTIYVVFGLFGTIWWYFLPNVFIAIDQRGKKKPTE